MASSSSRLPARKPIGSGSRSRPMSMFEPPTDHLKRLQQLGDGGKNDGNDPAGDIETSKQAKRRSLLPTFSTKRTSDEVDAFPAIREDTSDSEVNSRPATREERRLMPPPPKPTRTSSLRAPASSLASRTTTSHTRTISKESNGSAPMATTSPKSPKKVDTTIRRQASTRLPGTAGQQAIPTRGSSTRANTTTAEQAIPARGSSTRAATTTSLAQKRASVAISKPTISETPNHKRTSSSDQTSPTSPTSSTTSRQSAVTAPSGIARKQLAPPSKPAFSTYQQHYSPAKSALPKPPIPTAKPTRPATATTTENEPISLETALEQIELLQLSLLHQSSTQTLQQFEASAKRKLARHHTKLKKDFESIRHHEQEQRRIRNLSSLESWCPNAALLAEHLQTLSRVVSDLRGHTEPGSRYSDLTDMFDQWLSKAESTLLNSNTNVISVELLPDSWRSTHTSLSLKLRSIQRDISTMPPPPPASDEEHDSSLEIVLDSCSELVESMLKELEVMTKLHKEVLQQGKARIDEQVNAVVAASSNGANKENWVPAWQSVT